MAGVVDTLDRGQRKFPPVGFPIAVLYKFWDDQGNYLAAIITYYAFIAIFPLLLIASSVLGFVLQGRPDLQNQLLEAGLSQFPIIGDELGRTELRGSTGAVIVGSLTALYGAMGLGQAIQNAVNTAWSVPRNSRPNVFLLRLRSLALLGTAGLAIFAISLLSTLVGSTEAFGARPHGVVQWLLLLVTILIVGTVLTFLFRLATTRNHSLIYAAPGAFTFAISWQALQQLGTLYVDRVLAATSGMNATFALVLGLIGFIYIASVAGVLAIEINVVVERHLWPRALLTLFTDRVDLTEADRRAYAGYALMQRHKGFETVTVLFDGRDGQSHEIVMDPSWLQKATRKIRTRPRDELSPPASTTGAGRAPSPPRVPPPDHPPERPGPRAVPDPDDDADPHADADSDQDPDTGGATMLPWRHRRSGTNR